ncbi:hypothetical protein [Methanonatronarchaeum sp. AMET6-2]|uniref:DUF6979 family protein n=1 Tax=Methanonatronarchaeum sp. AMET6-2 TaxID=2933293 RepID=UPI00122A43DB|nr:hypothetical protein [Methanonatronarchaeum sp. AMET6-2]RZN63290.1 MAG: hypothetical protein EF811_00635 [Methanonatronarchaeia archaeon]UOY10051.1 hypothetical protein MU439_07280 [Methanonatronarchaeum sp. AMET6-2]
MYFYDQYGDVAVRAVEIVGSGAIESPGRAWDKAAGEIISSSSSRSKCCPKIAFLGLCEEGFVEGIESGDYTSSVKNKGYAVDALKLLEDKDWLSKNELWDNVAPSGKSYNSQIDVVVGLWSEGLIEL